MNRTFVGENPREIKIKLNQLRNILTAYAKRNPTMGYCQGQNFIVGHILRYLQEEEAFWLYCCLIEDILPIDYYLSMVGILVDQKIFGR